MRSFSKFLLLSVVFQFVACSGRKPNDKSQIPADRRIPVQANIPELKQFDAKYNPTTHKLTVGGLISSIIDNSFVADRAFDFKGDLGNGLKLTEPISTKREMAVNCSDAECLNFAVELPAEYLGRTLTIAMQRFLVQEIVTTSPQSIVPPSDWPGNSKPSVQEMWHRINASGAIKADSSLIIAKLGQRTFVNLYLSSANKSLFENEYVFLSWGSFINKVGLDTLYGGDGNDAYFSGSSEDSSVTLNEGELKFDIFGTSTTVKF